MGCSSRPVQTAVEQQREVFLLDQVTAESPGERYDHCLGEPGSLVGVNS
jgi:hypothetical protein